MKSDENKFELKDLKKQIETHELNIPNNLLFFVLKDDSSKFIATQYLKAIAEILNLEIKYIDDFNELPFKNQIFFQNTNTLYNLQIAKVTSIPENVDLKNVIIICSSINQDIESKFKDNIVYVPKLLNWQIEDFAKVIFKGVDETKIKWLCDICSDNVYRLSLEASKLSIFDENERDSIFDLINLDNGYSDLINLNIFNFISAIVKKDVQKITEILENIENIDIEPMGVVTLLKKQFKNIIDIQLNQHATAETLGMSLKQFNAIKYNYCRIYNQQQLLDIYYSIISIDYLLKSGQLEYSRIIDYLLTKIFSF